MVKAKLDGEKENYRFCIEIVVDKNDPNKDAAIDHIYMKMRQMQRELRKLLDKDSEVKLAL